MKFRFYLNGEGGEYFAIDRNDVFGLDRRISTQRGLRKNTYIANGNILYNAEKRMGMRNMRKARMAK